MKKYTFEELNDIEFESFVNDLFTNEYSWKIERYKEGRDGGIDGKILLANRTIIIQSKHYRKSGFTKLLNVLKNEELEKALKLKADRYIIATSLSLNHNDKQKIVTAYKKINLKEEDIYGNDDLNAILLKHPNILKNYYKLWAENTATLELFIHPEIHSKEIALASRLNKINKIFVQTEDVTPALESLNENHVVVLSGEPGVGKTTLAEYLCQIHMKDQYSVQVIEGDIESQPFNFTDKEKKVIYYFDDFLGSNYFNAITGNKDSAIVNFIDQIRIEPNKRFILTSRTNIIHKAQLFSQSFRTFGLVKKQYIIQISKYSKLTKAKILYSHLWNSEIDEDIKHQIISNSFFKTIISHRNFNPRLIAFSLSIEGFEGDDICESILKNLENPEQIWDQCYTAQIDEQARLMIKLCVANGGKISETSLEEAYDRALSIYNFIPTSNQPTDFVHTTKLVCNSLLNKNIDSNSVFYTHYNPSVSDYIIGKISSYSEASKLMKCLNTNDVVRFYHDLILTKKIKRNEAKKISRNLLENYGYYLSKRFYVSLHLALWLGNKSELLSEAVSVFNTIKKENYISTDVSTNLLTNIIVLGQQFGITDGVLQNLLELEPFDHNNLLEIFNALEKINPDNIILENIKNRIIDLLADSANEIVKTDSDIFECVNESDVDNLVSNVLDSLTEDYAMLNEDDLEKIRSRVSVDNLYEKIRDRDMYDSDDVKQPTGYDKNSNILSEDEEIERMFMNYNK